MDLKEITKNYEQMSDDKLIKVATTNAHGLAPEVLSIIENEIRKRKLNPDLLSGAIAQNKSYTLAEIERYSDLLRDLPCPICGTTHFRLNGTLSHTVKSFLLLTTYASKPLIACPDCLDKKNSSAILSTAVLGWWGFPWGLLKTPVYIYKNYKAKKENRQETANQTLLSFTLANVGLIETYKHDGEKLQEIIRVK